MTNSGLKDMWDAIPADIGIPKDVMDKARVALAYAQTQASEGDTDAAIAIIGKAIMAERERCAGYCSKVSLMLEKERELCAVGSDAWSAFHTASRQAFDLAEELARGDA